MTTIVAVEITAAAAVVGMMKVVAGTATPVAIRKRRAKVGETGKAAVVAAEVETTTIAITIAAVEVATEGKEAGLETHRVIPKLLEKVGVAETTTEEAEAEVAATTRMTATTIAEAEAATAKVEDGMEIRRAIPKRPAKDGAIAMITAGAAAVVAIMMTTTATTTAETVDKAAGSEILKDIRKQRAKAGVTEMTIAAAAAVVATMMTTTGTITAAVEAVGMADGLEILRAIPRLPAKGGKTVAKCSARRARQLLVGHAFFSARSLATA